MNDWQDLIGKITCADCLDILKQLPDKCVDLVCTDCPYHVVASGVTDQKVKDDNGLLKTILKVPNIIGDKCHPTEKPVQLMEVLIANSTNENDLVLEPFAGGGATCIAAKNLKRKFIGIEIDEEYAKIAQDRLEQEQKQQMLF